MKKTISPKKKKAEIPVVIADTDLKEEYLSSDIVTCRTCGDESFDLLIEGECAVCHNPSLKHLRSVLC